MQRIDKGSCRAHVICITDAVAESRETEFVNTVHAKSKLACKPLI